VTAPATDFQHGSTNRRGRRGCRTASPSPAPARLPRTARPHPRRLPRGTASPVRGSRVTPVRRPAASRRGRPPCSFVRPRPGQAPREPPGRDDRPPYRSCPYAAVRGSFVSG